MSLAEHPETTRWTEADFEHWFLPRAELPAGERLLIVARHRSLRRVVDLLCLDADARLVLIEVKNESSTRLAVGQALEYLAATADASLEDIADEAEGDLHQRFEEAFGSVAPAFDAPSVLATTFLAGCLASQNISMRLLRAARDGDNFRLSWYDGPAFTRSRNLSVGPALSPRGRLYFILEAGSDPVLWNVGRRDSAGQLRPTRGKALSRRAVRVRNNYLAQIEGISEVTAGLQGTVWRHRTKVGRQAKVLGEVQTVNGAAVAFVRFRDGRLRRCQLQLRRKFERDWMRSDDELPNWRTIAGLLKEAEDQLTARSRRPA